MNHLELSEDTESRGPVEAYHLNSLSDQLVVRNVDCICVCPVLYFRYIAKPALQLLKPLCILLPAILRKLSSTICVPGNAYCTLYYYSYSTLDYKFIPVLEDRRTSFWLPFTRDTIEFNTIPVGTLSSCYSRTVGELRGTRYRLFSVGAQIRVGL